MVVSRALTAPLVALPAGASGVDVRPLAVRATGTLTLATPDQNGRAFLSAASGMVASQGVAWMVSDELGELASFARVDAPGTLHPALERHQDKPDLESIALVPRGVGGLQSAALFAPGSGSNKHRGRAALQLLDDGGMPSGLARTVDLSRLYAQLDTLLPKQPNIEGALVRGAGPLAELLLFHRGKQAGDVNTVFVLDANAVFGAAMAGLPAPESAIKSQHVIDLGMLGTERLGFADAHLLADGRIVFVASAEGNDANGDGAIIGSAVGILDAKLALTALRPLTGIPRKVEGLELTSALGEAKAGAMDLTLVTDPDDPTKSGEVLRVDLG